MSASSKNSSKKSSEAESKNTLKTPAETEPKKIAEMPETESKSVPKVSTYPSISMTEIKSKINMAELTSKSLSALHLKEGQTHSDLKSLLSLLQEKSQTINAKLRENEENKKGKPIHELDFLDYFAAKDGLRYIGFLEQLQYNYENKCKALTYNINAEILKKSHIAQVMIQAMGEYHILQSDIELQDYDFGVIIDKILNHFPIDASKKLQDIVKYHNYGIKMILHWVYVIQRNTKVLDPNHLEATAIELLADIMAPSYAIFIHFAEFIICMADGPEEVKHGYPIEDIISYLRRFYESVVQECSAIAQSVGEVMVRIPNVGQDLVIEKMTKIYFAVNHCSYTTCRVLDALGPMIHYYKLTSLLALNASKTVPNEPNISIQPKTAKPHK